MFTLPRSGVGYALEAVVGQGLGSIAGGIGVENLQGSGLIAGETSRVPWRVRPWAAWVAGAELVCG